jgi:glycosyltransferase involved in cell wall biosynthesis
VADLGPELLGADVSVVPIRVGAGTRLKVVEAMANHLPLVTTTVGCEGIDVVDGRSAMIEDHPRRFADACLQLIGDGALRQRLADTAADLFAERYTWEAIGTTVAELATRTARSPDIG